MKPSSNGSLMMNSSNDLDGEYYRVVHISKDGGESFYGSRYLDLALPDAGKCQGSILEHSMNAATGKADILFSNPNDLYERVNGTIGFSIRDSRF